MNLSTLVATRIAHLHHARISRAEIERMQLRKFRRLIAFAARRSPYYATLVRERGIDPAACTPADFPVLTKTEAMRNFDTLVTDPRVRWQAVTDFLARSRDPAELFAGAFYVVHTSGSSGELGYFVYSRRDWTRGIAQALRINPFRPRRRRLAFFGATEGHFTGVSFAATCRKSLLRALYNVAWFDINRPLGPTIEGLNSFRPDILMGYPSGLAILADCQRAGALRIAPEFVQSSGEPVVAADRAAIETTFGVPLLNVYSCTEHLIMGYAHPAYDGMYLFEDDLIFEPAADHTLVTNLFNWTQPLIRYRMSDVLAPIEDAAPRLPFRKIREVAGRHEHVPIFRNRHGEEDFISPHIINELLIPGVRRFQLRVINRTACELRVCLAPGLEAAAAAASVAAAERRLAEIFAAKGLDNVRGTVRVVQDLAPDGKTGKFRLIVPADAEAMPTA